MVTIVVTKDDIHRMIDRCTEEESECEKLKCLALVLATVLQLVMHRGEEICTEPMKNSPWGE